MIDNLVIYRYDGKPTRFTKFVGNWDTIAARRISDYEISEERTMSNGQFRSTSLVSVSADGRTMTVKIKGVNSRGKAFTSINIFDKEK